MQPPDAERTPRKAARTLAGASRRVAGVSARAAGSTRRRVRQATTAQGAGESGLSKVIELHAVAAASDALVLISLANTVFFAVPVGEARGRVALYLLVTMLPFSVLAPVIGPLLDRFTHGRRYALALTLLTRAWLAWVMAGAVAGGKEAFALYPAAFGHLVASKAYTVARAAAIPRVQPPGLSLVTANSRVLLGGLAAVAVVGGVGGLVLKAAGPEWSLRLAFVLFAVGAGLALALPRQVDSAEGEVRARLSSDVAGGSAGHPDGGRARHRWSIGPRVVLGLRAVAALRAFTGFLTLFLAFALRSDPLPGSLSVLAVIGAVAGAAGVGNGIGTSLGAVLSRLTPEVVVTAMVALAAAGAAVGSVGYGLVPLLATGLAAGLASALGKLSLDALVQREVPEAVRTSAFARSETVLQLAWVLGGAVGITLPLAGQWGLALAAALLLVALVATARSLAVVRRPTVA